MNILCYLLSCIIFSLGATSFIFSDLGTDPLDVFCLGIQNHFDIKIGTIQSFFALFCLLIYSFLNKWKIPPLSTGITFIICGYMIDFFRFSLDYFKDFNSYILLFFGCALCLQGSAGIILSGIGIRAMDLLALSLEEITKKPFWLYKGIAEVILLFTGWILGGPVGIGTVLFLLTVGWLIQPVINLNKKLFNI
jgi:uncharacterized membrane protein YczE